jgi:hypothetical protein
MKTRNLVGVVFLLATQSAFALGQCPAEVKECGPNPFYILAVGFSQLCSERHPENAPLYKAALDNFAAENRKAYAKLDVDAQFRKELQDFKQKANTMTSEELDNECRRFLSERQGETHHRSPIND